MNAGNILKGILYTGLAAGVGVIAYIAGKSKHWKGISLTTMGLALILYTPRGCETLEKYLIIRGEVNKAEIYGSARKDSLDAILVREAERDSSKNYVSNALHEISSLEDNMRNEYMNLIVSTQRKYESIISDDRQDYDKIVEDMRRQNDALLYRLDAMKNLQEQANDLTARISTDVKKDGSNIRQYTAPENGDASDDPGNTRTNQDIVATSNVGVKANTGKMGDVDKRNDASVVSSLRRGDKINSMYVPGSDAYYKAIERERRLNQETMERLENQGYGYYYRRR